MPMLTFANKTDGQELVAAPAAGLFIRVIGGELSNEIAVPLVSLKSGSTVIWQSEKMNATPFSVEINVHPERTIDCAPGQALNIGASAAAVSGNLEYLILGRENQQLS